MKLEDSIKTIKLIDTYGKLLTTRQFDIISNYYFDNLSLSEIGDNFGISRQAVSDSINQSVKALELYEEKLGIIENNEKLINSLSSISVKCKDMNVSERLNEIIEELRG